MSAYLFFNSQTLRFDVVTNEQTEHTATATEHPVEAGADVTDHVRDKLDRVTLEVFVSNTPIADVNGLYSPTITNIPLDVPSPPGAALFTPGGLTQAVGNALDAAFSGTVTTPAANVLTFGASPFNAVRDTMETLLAWKKGAVVGAVITPWKTFDSMVIERVAPLRNAPMGDGAQIQIELREIRLVATSLVKAPQPTIISATPSKPKGQQMPTPADAGKSSLALKLAQGLGLAQ